MRKWMDAIRNIRWAYLSGTNNRIVNGFILVFLLGHLFAVYGSWIYDNRNFALLAALSTFLLVIVITWYTGLLKGTIATLLLIGNNIAVTFLLNEPYFSEVLFVGFYVMLLLVGMVVGLISHTNRKIVQLLRQKDMLIGEVYHRVKNNINMIVALVYLELERKTDNADRDLLQRIINRMNQLAGIHQYLYSSQESYSISFSRFVDMLLKEGVGSRQKLSVQVEPTTVQYDPETLILLGVLIQEVLAELERESSLQQQKGMVTISLRSSLVYHNLFFQTMVPCGLLFDKQKTTLSSKIVYEAITRLAGHCEMRVGKPPACVVSFMPLGLQRGER